MHGLATQSDNERFAWDSYRRLIQMFGETVLGMDGDLRGRASTRLKHGEGVRGDLDLDAADLRDAGRRRSWRLVEEPGAEFPQDPREQLDRGGRRGVLVVELPTGAAVSPPGAYSATIWGPR